MYSAIQGRVRRNIVSFLGLLLLSVGSMSMVQAAEVQSEYLKATDYIDSQHPSIQALAHKLTHGVSSGQQKAIAIHNYVRDEVLFGFTAQFYRMKASEVLAAGKGFGNTKGTLFIALLRAAGIPARAHFVSLDKSILDPFMMPPVPYLDHSYTEVWLDNCWVKVDSYIVDADLYRNAISMLKTEPKPQAFGVYRNGSRNWDGKSDCFVQYNAKSMGEDFGVYQDVADFYAKAKHPNNKMSLLGRLDFGINYRYINATIEAFRSYKLDGDLQS